MSDENPITDRVERDRARREFRENACANQVNWACSYRTLTKRGKGEPYGYDKMHPWIPALKAKHRRKFFFKSRKVTFTEQGVNFVCWRIDAFPGTNAAYIRETQRKANAQMRGRFDPAIMDPRNPMRDRVIYNQVETKIFKPGDPMASGIQILSAYGTKTGAAGQQSGDKVRGDTIHTLFYDERQLQPSKMEGVVGKSIPLDEVLYSMTGGTPTVSGNILGTMWRQTSQHTLLFKCWSCKTWQELVFDSIHNPDNPEKAYIGCCKCHASLEWMRGKYGRIQHPENGREGIVQWVPQKLHGIGHPKEGQADTDHSMGFRLDRFCLALSPLEEPYFGTPEGATRYILADWADPDLSHREKVNEILGREYDGPDAPFSMSRMLRCVVKTLSFEVARREEYLTRILTYDWGVETTWNVWGLTPDLRKVLIAYGKIEGDQRTHDKKLIVIGKDYNITWAVGDKGYSANREMSLVEVWKRKAVSIFYATHEKRSLRAKKRMVWFQAENVLVADRNYVIELFQQEVAKGTNGVIIPGKKIEQVEIDLFSEYANVKFGDPPDPGGLGIEIKQEQTKWMKSGDDHHLHCGVYANIGCLMHKRSTAIGYRHRAGQRGWSLMEDDAA